MLECFNCKLSSICLYFPWFSQRNFKGLLWLHDDIKQDLFISIQWYWKYIQSEQQKGTFLLVSNWQCSRNFWCEESSNLAVPRRCFRTYREQVFGFGGGHCALAEMYFREVICFLQAQLSIYQVFSMKSWFQWNLQFHKNENDWQFLVETVHRFEMREHIGITALQPNARNTQGDTQLLELTLPFVFWVQVLPTCGGWLTRSRTLWLQMLALDV